MVLGIRLGHARTNWDKEPSVWKVLRNRKPIWTLYSYNGPRLDVVQHVAVIKLKMAQLGRSTMVDDSPGLPAVISFYQRDVFIDHMISWLACGSLE